MDEQGKTAYAKAAEASARCHDRDKQQHRKRAADLCAADACYLQSANLRFHTQKFERIDGPAALKHPYA